MFQASSPLFTTPWFAVSTLNLLEAVFVILSIIGQEFIVRRDRRCFQFWIVGNIVGIVLNAVIGHWMSCVLYAYFTVKSVQGNANWQALERAALSSTASVAAVPRAPPARESLS